MRTLTISSQYQARRRSALRVPFIRLSGKWLAKAGFRTGARIAVRVENGALVISGL